MFRFTVIFLMAALAATAQPNDRTHALDEIFSDYEVIQLDPGDIERQVKDFGEPLAVEIDGAQFVFELEPRDLRSPRYRAEATGDDGLRRSLPEPEVNTFKGTVTGAPHIQGRFTITEDSFDGVVFTPGDWLYIEPVSNYRDDSEPSDMVAYRHSAIIHDEPFRCGASSLHHLIEAGAAKINPSPNESSHTDYTAEVATEADYEYVRELGGASEANREILSILNRVEGVYESELDLKLEVVYQHAWTTRDDPYRSSNLRDRLDEFGEHWNENFFHEGYDLAHLWSGTDDSKRSGIAWIGTVCSAPMWSYGVSGHYRLNPFKFILAAHEIGHNFGATHPNDHDSPPTNCRNTIMWTPRSRSAERLNFCGFSEREIARHVSRHDYCLNEDEVTNTPSIAAPSSLTAEAVSSDMIRLEWQDNSHNEWGFGIERRSGSGSFQLLGWNYGNRTTFGDTGLEPATAYGYRVYAYNSDLEPSTSTWSNTAVATTLDTDVPCEVNPDGLVLDEQFTLPAVDAPTLFSGGWSFKVAVPSDATAMSVAIRTLTPFSDVDLYLRHGSDVDLEDGRVVADHYSASGSGTEVIYITPASDPPLRAGTYYIAFGLFTTGKAVEVVVSAKIER